jgi:hypothetical protein
MSLSRFLIFSYLIIAIIASSSLFSGPAQGTPAERDRAFGDYVSVSGNQLEVLDINFSDPSLARASIDVLNDLSNSTAARQAIREVRVSGYPSLGDWTLVRNVFARLEYVETMHWVSWKAMPPQILRSLEWQDQPFRLYYTLRFTHEDPHDTSLDPEHDWDPYDDPRDSNYGLREERERRHKLALRSIINSKILYSLKADIEYGSDDNFEDLGLVFDTITSAPNLRELDLQFHTKGCSLGNSPFAFDFRSNPTSRFPPLEVLKLTAYQLDERSDGGYAWSWKDFIGDERTERDYETDGFPSVPSRRADDGRSNLDA